MVWESFVGAAFGSPKQKLYDITTWGKSTQTKSKKSIKLRKGGYLLWKKC